ncbi:hypothetical protein ABPG72_020666 [Tetrahymena utriculariae]
MQKQENLLKLEYYLEQVENIQKQVQAIDDNLQQMIKRGVSNNNYIEAQNLQQEIELMLKQNSQSMQQYISQFSNNIIRISQAQQRQQLMQRCIDGGHKAEKQMKSILKNLQTLSDQIFEQKKKKIQVDQKLNISQASYQSSDYFKSEISGSKGNQEDIQENMQVIDYEQEIVKQRQDELDKIQQLVNNLNSMMIQLFDMIKEQGKCLNLIEENINQMHPQMKGSKYVTNNSSEFSDQLSDKILNKKDLESNQCEPLTTSQVKNKSKKLWFIIIALLIIAGVGIGIYLGVS